MVGVVEETTDAVEKALAGATAAIDAATASMAVTNKVTNGATPKLYFRASKAVKPQSP